MPGGLSPTAIRPCPRRRRAVASARPEPERAIADETASRTPRHPGVVRVLHALTALGTLALAVSGVAILLAHPRLYWGETGAVGTPALIDLPIPFLLGHSGWGRYMHFQAAWLCVLAGLVYLVWGVARGHFRRALLPEAGTLTLASIRAAVADHLRPAASGPAGGARSYNVLQRLAYLGVVFVLGPVVVLSGLAFSPALASVAPWLPGMFGGQQSARTVHFFASSGVVVFLGVHLVMVWRTGFVRQVLAMTPGVRGRAAAAASHEAGRPTPIPAGLTRRRFVRAGVATAAGAAGLTGGIRLAERKGLIPPDGGGIWGPGETLTYASQRLLTGGESLAREFPRSAISTVFPVNGRPPQEEQYQTLLAGGFADWRLRVDGLVARPREFSLGELRGYPAHSQITHQACEEGWSYIAEWTGVRLSYVLDLVGVEDRARWVVFFPYDGFWESLDMADALHPQTFLAYGMNGEELPPDYGAPVRLKVARQLGYKSVKFLSRITVAESLDSFGTGVGGINPEYGYSWWAGI